MRTPGLVKTLFQCKSWLIAGGTFFAMRGEYKKKGPHEAALSDTACAACDQEVGVPNL